MEKLLLLTLTILFLFTACAPASETEIAVPSPTVTIKPTEAPEISKIISYSFNLEDFKCNYSGSPTVVFNSYEEFVNQIKPYGLVHETMPNRIKLDAKHKDVYERILEMEKTFNEEYFANGNSVALLYFDIKTLGSQLIPNQIIHDANTTHINVLNVAPDPYFSDFDEETYVYAGYYLLFVGLDGQHYDNQSIEVNIIPMYKHVWEAANIPVDEKIIHYNASDYLSNRF